MIGIKQLYLLIWTMICGFISANIYAQSFELPTDGKQFTQTLFLPNEKGEVRFTAIDGQAFLCITAIAEDNTIISKQRIIESGGSTRITIPKFIGSHISPKQKWVITASILDITPNNAESQVRVIATSSFFTSETPRDLTDTACCGCFSQQKPSLLQRLTGKVKQLLGQSSAQSGDPNSVLIESSILSKVIKFDDEVSHLTARCDNGDCSICVTAISHKDGTVISKTRDIKSGQTIQMAIPEFKQADNAPKDSWSIHVNVIDKESSDTKVVVSSPDWQEDNNIEPLTANCACSASNNLQNSCCCTIEGLNREALIVPADAEDELNNDEFLGEPNNEFADPSGDEPVIEPNDDELFEDNQQLDDGNQPEFIGDAPNDDEQPNLIPDGPQDDENEGPGGQPDDPFADDPAGDPNQDIIPPVDPDDELDELDFPGDDNNQPELIPDSQDDEGPQEDDQFDGGERPELIPDTPNDDEQPNLIPDGPRDDENEGPGGQPDDPFADDPAGDPNQDIIPPADPDDELDEFDFPEDDAPLEDPKDNTPPFSLTPPVLKISTNSTDDEDFEGNELCFTVSVNGDIANNENGNFSAVTGRLSTRDLTASSSTESGVKSDYIAIVNAPFSLSQNKPSHEICTLANEDLEIEPTEYFQLIARGDITLSDGSQRAFAEQSIGTIFDGNRGIPPNKVVPPPGGPKFPLKVMSVQGFEGDTLSFQIIADRTLGGLLAHQQRILGAFEVTVFTADGTANATSDYSANQKTLSFADGQDFAIFKVATSLDAIREGSETFTVNIDLKDMANIIDVPRTSAIGTGTISDHTPIIRINEASTQEGGNLNFEITGTKITHPVTISYRSKDGGANAGVDYTGVPVTTKVFKFALGPNPLQAIHSEKISVATECFKDPNPQLEGAEDMFIVLDTSSNPEADAATQGRGVITDCLSISTPDPKKRIITPGVEDKRIITFPPKEEGPITEVPKGQPPLKSKPDDIKFSEEQIEEIFSQESGDTLTAVITHKGSPIERTELGGPKTVVQDPKKDSGTTSSEPKKDGLGILELSPEQIEQEKKFLEEQGRSETAGTKEETVSETTKDDTTSEQGAQKDAQSGTEQESDLAEEGDTGTDSFLKELAGKESEGDLGINRRFLDEPKDNQAQESKFEEDPAVAEERRRKALEVVERSTNLTPDEVTKIFENPNDPFIQRSGDDFFITGDDTLVSGEPQQTELESGEIGTDDNLVSPESDIVIDPLSDEFDRFPKIDLSDDFDLTQDLLENNLPTDDISGITTGTSIEQNTSAPQSSTNVSPDIANRAKQACSDSGACNDGNGNNPNSSTGGKIIDSVASGKAPSPTITLCDDEDFKKFQTFVDGMIATLEGHINPVPTSNTFVAIGNGGEGRAVTSEPVIGLAGTADLPNITTSNTFVAIGHGGEGRTDTADGLSIQPAGTAVFSDGFESGGSVTFGGIADGSPVTSNLSNNQITGGADLSHSQGGLSAGSLSGDGSFVAGDLSDSQLNAVLPRDTDISAGSATLDPSVVPLGSDNQVNQFQLGTAGNVGGSNNQNTAIKINLDNLTLTQAQALLALFKRIKFVIKDCSKLKQVVTQITSTTQDDPSYNVFTTFGSTGLEDTFERLRSGAGAAPVTGGATSSTCSGTAAASGGFVNSASVNFVLNSLGQIVSCITGGSTLSLFTTDLFTSPNILWSRFLDAAFTAGTFPTSASGPTSVTFSGTIRHAATGRESFVTFTIAPGPGSANTGAGSPSAPTFTVNTSSP